MCIYYKTTAFLYYQHIKKKHRNFTVLFLNPSIRTKTPEEEVFLNPSIRTKTPEEEVRKFACKANLADEIRCPTDGRKGNSHNPCV